MKTAGRHKWIPPKAVDYQVVRAFEAEFPVHPRVLELLVRRGLNDPVEMDRFLKPKLEHLHDPFRLSGMQSAAERLARAVHACERICIFGDYDVDGVTSTALLVRFFRSLRAEIDYFIPHRIHDGYGLSLNGMKEVKGRGTSVIVTVDNGIADVEEVAWAQANGMDVIVTDHHQVPESTPPAHAIINPHQPGCDFPFKLLAGCGVAFNLAMAVRRLLRERGHFSGSGAEPNLKELTVFAALGTVADVVPLVDENRIFVHYGLAILENPRFPGLRALKEVAGLGSRELTARDIAFGLAPRLNAAGRMASAKAGVELLVTDDPVRARELAAGLDSQNIERKSVENEMLVEAVEQIETGGLLDKYRSLVVWKEGWHPGVIGIVAARLVDKYYRPAIVLAVEGGKAKGSCRTIRNYNIYEGLRFAHQPDGGKDPGTGLFESFGGHKYAAGLSLPADRIGLLIDRLEENVRTWTSDEDFIPEISLDASLRVDEVTPELVHDISRLRPFGVGNPSPVFEITGGSVRWPKILKEQHLKFRLSDPVGRSLDVIGFGLGTETDPSALAEKSVDVAGYLELNRYPPDNPNPSVQIRLQEYRVRPVS